jgi:thymidylate synthase
MKQYVELAERILFEGIGSSDRTGTGTISVFGHQMRFKMSDGFPLLALKKVHFKSVVHELIWMLSGSTNIKYLNDNGVTIWDEWADEHGDLGPIYGSQWRRAGFDHSSIDQIQNAVDLLKSDPSSRRIIVDCWQVGDIDLMALPPCHMMFQLYSRNSDLSMQMYLRSSDFFLGLPFNIAQYALLLKMFASVTGMVANELIITIGDAHIYKNHIEQVKIIIERYMRDTLSEKERTCWVNLAQKNGIFDYTYKDITLVGYNPWPAIKGEVSI